MIVCCERDLHGHGRRQWALTEAIRISQLRGGRPGEQVVGEELRFGLVEVDRAELPHALATQRPVLADVGEDAVALYPARAWSSLFQSCFFGLRYPAPL